jgi:hypothetical protein
MDSLIDLLNEYREYVVGAMGLIVLLVMLNIILKRPTREEKEHQKRFDSLKAQSKDRYRDLRPLR